MIKRTTAIVFVLLANILILAHAVVPHHHHNKQVCLVNSHCINESFTDEYGTNHDSHSHDGENNSNDSYMKKITLGRENSLREMTVNLAQVKSGDCVLEVGCGTGTLTLAAKRQTGQSGKVFGVDVIPEMIEISQRKAAQAKLDVTFLLGNIDNIPFPENHFDVVMCSFMIFHLSEKVRRKGIAEIYRVLKPQGRLMVLDLTLPNRPVSRAIAKVLLGFMLKHDLKELLPMLEFSGFTGIQISQAKYRVFGFSLLSYVSGIK